LLWRSPGFTSVAVISLGLGIGANTAIFSLVDGLWTRPMAVPGPGQIVRLFSVTNQNSQGLFSFPEYMALRDQTGSFQGIVARGGRGARMPNGDGSSDLLLVNVVSTNFFSVLGIQPAAGRLFAPEDQALLEKDPVVVLGNSFWKRRFGGDAGIVGRQILLSRGGNIPFTVLGVLPDNFRALLLVNHRSSSRALDFFTPPPLFEISNFKYGILPIIQRCWIFHTTSAF